MSAKPSLSFSEPNHFTKKKDGWICNVCNPSSSDHAMNIHTALRHERNSAQHARNIAESEMWWNPPVQDAAVWAAPLIEEPPLTKEELTIREHQDHVERVPLLVPYWLKCVNAAARGVELRMEPFLESLQEASQSWVKKDPNPWGDAAWGWGEAEDAGRWGVHPDNKSSSDSIHSGSRTMSTRTGRPRTGSMRGIADGDAYAFVEDIALQEAADAERKRRMHNFFEMPTDDKIKQIDAMIRCLRSTPD